MSETRYTKDHEWIRVEDGIGTVGITDYAQSQLGDVVFIELPAKGRKLACHEEAAVVESVKAASEIFAPVGGEVVEANAALVENPALVNSDAGGAGWFFRLRLADPAELGRLMDEGAYQAFVKGLA